MTGNVIGLLESWKARSDGKFYERELLIWWYVYPAKTARRHQRHTIRSSLLSNPNELNNGTTQSHKSLSYGELSETERLERKKGETTTTAIVVMVHLLLRQ